MLCVPRVFCYVYRVVKENLVLDIFITMDLVILSCSFELNLLI